ncbi:hypothetical protein FIV38_16445 [Pseudomonas proteolytica]|nr:hypothetical protein F4W61_08965 [Pseudomonas proteolytica]TWR80651.1 hypothetical protein FIV38_16445 [Pseudomonas proteolytica]
MDGRSRRAHGAMPDCGHAEPRRGTEWWGKSPLVTLGLFSKVTRRKGGTHSRRYRSKRICTPIQAPLLTRLVSHATPSSRHQSIFLPHRTP